ncbi:MAG: hypothetical protein JW720_08435 [Sedimentisphaerales bacterium]|nr:hypothetical protein [Sedimentisphaerales bacterium]
MNKRGKFFAIVVLFVTVLCSAGWSVENQAIRNPSVSNPAGVSTAPPSSLGEGLVTSPNPLDRSSDLSITGNVRRGRHFRDYVPYSSTTSFGDDLGSSSLDSFLRDSAGVEDIGDYRGKYQSQPYYSWSRTVTGAVPGRSGVYRPYDYGAGGSLGESYRMGTSLHGTDMSLQDSSATGQLGRFESLTSGEISRLASGEARVGPQNETTSGELYRKQMEQLRLELMNMRRKSAGRTTAAEGEKEDLLRLLPEPGVNRTKPATDSAEELAMTQKLLSRPETGKSGQGQSKTPGEKWREKVKEFSEPKSDFEFQSVDDLLSRYKEDTNPTASEGDKAEVESAGMTDIEKLTAQIAELKRKGSGQSALGSPAVGTKGSVAEDGEVTDSPTTTASIGSYSRSSARELPSPGSSADISLPSHTEKVLANAYGHPDLRMSNSVGRVDSLSTNEIKLQANKIVAPYGSYESYNQARFRERMKEAAVFLKEGKFYQAANAFARASIFESKNPDALAGRSLALFGAGEYMSSALFLSRAIEASEEYAGSKIDIAVMMGDKNKLNSRIADAEEWLERSCASELEFLLAYMYYRTGNLDSAKESITTAAKEMPNSKAVKTLKKVIEASMEAAAKE